MPSGASRANQRQSRTRKRQYDKYKMENTYTKNKIKKLLRHLKDYPMDTGAAISLVAYGKIIGKDYEHLYKVAQAAQAKKAGA